MGHSVDFAENTEPQETYDSVLVADLNLPESGLI